MTAEPKEDEAAANALFAVEVALLKFLRGLTGATNALAEIRRIVAAPDA